LCVEDEQRVRAFMVRGLTEEGFVVQEARDAPGALAILAAEPVELMLVDWMLPGTSGLELLKTLRARGEMVPVVMVTARDSARDRVEALNAGADDYLDKPFVFDELVARIRSVLRRSQGRAQSVLRCADLVLEPAARRATRGGRELRLTAREFALLQFLMEQAGRVVSRTQIIEAVWEHDFETFSNVVEVYVSYLRTKVDEPFAQKLIHTVRGVGYVLRSEP
jgi:two-component system copper resistance phosphate regulon response regulator CusR